MVPLTPIATWRRSLRNMSSSVLANVRIWLERAKNGAREPTERVLAADKARLEARLMHSLHQLAELMDARRQEAAAQLERERAEYLRRGQELALYAQQRHRGYARIYRRYRIAADEWKHVMMCLGGADEYKQRQADALKSLRRAKNAEIVDDLYMSDGVRDHVDAVRVTIAAFSAAVTTRRDGESVENMLEKESTMEIAIVQLRNAMRDELRTATDVPRVARSRG